MSASERAQAILFGVAGSWGSVDWTAAATVAAALDWSALLLGIITGLFGTAGLAWVARRQFSGTPHTATGDGLLALTEGFMKLQQEGYTKAHERIAVLETKVEKLEKELADERSLRQRVELENARLKAGQA